MYKKSKIFINKISFALKSSKLKQLYFEFKIRKQM